MTPVTVVGIDCATVPKKMGLARGSYENGSVKVEQVQCADTDLVVTIAGWIRGVRFFSSLKPPCDSRPELRGCQWALVPSRRHNTQGAAMPWIAWFLLALSLVIAEVFVPGFFLASLGIAALVASAAAALGLTATQQVGVFAVVTFLSYFAFRRVFEAVFHPAERRIATNTAALMGQHGLVIAAVDGLRGGRVSVAGDDWRAVSEDEALIAEGDAVVVTAINGVTLTVRRRSTP